MKPEIMNSEGALQVVYAREKKRAVISIIIFLVICLAFMLMQSNSYAYLQDNEVLFYITYMIYLFSPMIGCIAARLITGEGLSIKVEGGLRMGILLLLILFGQCYYTAFITAGEELGWRALLYDKLEILIGTNGALIAGGILWGLWHFPALYYTGINFGKDYPGFPYVGILLMCMATCFIGAPLWLVRKMSGSVIPACVFHGIIDSVCSGFLMLFLSESCIMKKMFQIGILSLVLPSVIIGVPAWIYLLKWTGKHHK